MHTDEETSKKTETTVFGTESELGKSMKAYCVEPWHSPTEELPPYGKKVIIATYVGMENLNSQLPGYRVDIGYCIEAWVSKVGLYASEEEYADEKNAPKDMRVVWIISDDSGVHLYHRPSRDRSGRGGHSDYGSSRYRGDEYVYTDPVLEETMIHGIYGSDVKLESPDFWMYIPPIK